MNGSGAGDDSSAITSQLTATIALQQEQIDSLNSKLSNVIKRLDQLESSQLSPAGKFSVQGTITWADLWHRFSVKENALLLAVLKITMW